MQRDDTTNPPADAIKVLDDASNIDAATATDREWTDLLVAAINVVAAYRRVMTDPTGEVTQSDREAAADSSSHNVRWGMKVCAGMVDNDPLVQAFARHRIASTIPDPAALDAAEARGYERGLREAADEVQAWFPVSTMDEPRYAAGRALKAAILAKLEARS